MNRQEADQLIERYLNGTATAEERRIVDSWYMSVSRQKALSGSDNFEHLSGELYHNILKRANLLPPKKNTYFWQRVAAAASLLLAVTVSGYLYLNHKQVPEVAKQQKKSALLDVSPGGNKAILTLANGKKIALTGAKNGRLANDLNVVINKTADGEVIYQGGVNAFSKQTYNTMTTPRGGQYALTLSDGTKVFLNAASSITYPTAFTGQDRTVELTGEAYFEVAHNRLKPFMVKSNGQTIRVLGTHFNVHSYPDERLLKTTLVEGSVKVMTSASMAVLTPGQQSSIDVATGASKINISMVDIHQEIAWKEGLFAFNNSTLKEVMENASRWYDLNVSYSNKVSDIRITGRMSRNVNLSGLINLLEYEGAKFSIDGKNITVLN